MHFQTGCINKFLIPDQSFKSSISTCFTLACFFFCSVCSCVRYNRLQIHHALFECDCLCVGVSDRLIVVRTRKIIKKSQKDRIIFKIFLLNLLNLLFFLLTSQKALGFLLVPRCKGQGQFGTTLVQFMACSDFCIDPYSVSFRKSNRKKYTKNGKSIKYTGTIYLQATPALWGAKYLIVVVVYKKVACCCCCCFPHYYSLLFFTIYFHVGKLFSRFVFCFARISSCLCVSFCVFFLSVSVWLIFV